MRCWPRPEPRIPTCSAPISTVDPRVSWAAPPRSRRTSSRAESSEWRFDMYDMPNEIQVEADGPLRIITLNRPEELNAVNDDLHVGLARIWNRLSLDPTARVAVITGAGKAFSAGGDFNYIKEL